MEDSNTHVTLKRTQAPGRIPKSDGESSRETLQIMLSGDRSKTRTHAGRCSARKRQVGFRGASTRAGAKHCWPCHVEIDGENRVLERLRDAAARMITRINPITRTQEQRTYTVHHRNTRLQQRFREQKIQEMADGRVLTYRSSSQNRQAESSRQSQRNIAARAQLSEDERERQRRRSRATAREQYLRNIKDGPTKFCTCCGGTWFPSQVSGLNFSLDNAFYLSRKFPSPSGKYQFCSTCRQGDSKGRIPSFCLSNGFDFPEIPECRKNLTCLEERLIFPSCAVYSLDMKGIEE